MKYPNPCVRCGLCCLHEPCPIALHELGIVRAVGKVQPCPMLRWSDAGAKCGMVEDAPDRAAEFGIGAGCCIKALAVTKNGETWNFAAMPEETKTTLAQMARRQLEKENAL